MSIYQHFRPEEGDFIDLALNWKEYVENTFAPKVTDFLDPREQQIVTAIIGRQGDIQVQFFGGAKEAERKRALLFPDYYQPGEEDFQIALYEIKYPKKFITIEHRQVLGSLMSLGLKRGKYGDILLDGDQAQFFAVKEIGDYIGTQLDSIGRAAVSIVEKPLKDAIQIRETWVEVTDTVSSLRLDAVVSALYNFSRQKSQLLIQQGHVKVNWTTIESKSFECGEGDILSIRGFGRAKVMSIEGKTKKDKWRIIAGKQK